MEGNAQKSVLNAAASWRTTRVTTVCSDDHQVQTGEKIVGELSELLHSDWTNMLVFGKDWKTRFTLDSELFDDTSHKVESSVRSATRTSHHLHSSHIQLQTVLPRWESSNRLQTLIIPRRR